jgi:death on curing protein
LAGEPRWVALEAVVALNREEVAKTGERHELLDRAALEIAVKRPWNVWVYFMDRDFATLAMSLLVAIAGARAFAAGNERTAYRAAAALLEANGVALDLGANRERAEERLFEYFRGRLSQAGVADWFKLWMSPAAPPT